MSRRSGVSVVVVAHNESANIRRCIQSILNQNHPDLFEVLVIDNASTDNTVEIVTELALKEPLVRLVCRTENNLGSARAEGIAKAQTELVAFLDGDCEAQPNWLENLTRRWGELSGRFVAVGGPHNFVRGGSLFSISRTYLPCTWMGH